MTPDALFKDLERLAKESTQRFQSPRSPSILHHDLIMQAQISQPFSAWSIMHSSTLLPAITVAGKLLPKKQQR
jgi:hypothetical protein